jgi:hypothetical protein
MQNILCEACHEAARWVLMKGLSLHHPPWKVPLLLQQ